MRYLLALVSLLCVVGVSVAAPLGPVSPEVSYGVHANFTQGDLPGPMFVGTKLFKDAYGPGLGGGAHLNFGLPGLSLRLSGDYLRYSLEEKWFREPYVALFGNDAKSISVRGGGLEIILASANAKVAVMPLPVVRPYVTGGAGLAWFSVAETRTSIAGGPGRTFPGTTQHGKKSFNVGAGVDLEVGIKLFVEARYVWILTEGEKSTYAPVAIGVTF
jgi:opacity protein-like surface antigen